MRADVQHEPTAQQVEGREQIEVPRARDVELTARETAGAGDALVGQRDGRQAGQHATDCARERHGAEPSQAITPCLNARATIERTLASVSEQACGGFLITERVAHLGRYHELDGEVGVSDGVESLIERTRCGLDHPDERARVGARLPPDAAEHTYDHRFAEIFRAVEAA
ncbi:MAG TPA: glycosyltransferase [Solirubrobacteraceae bacterium]|nr:glycosyltransferase [Solirubrobacteraceae bacterium]